MSRPLRRAAAVALGVLWLAWVVIVIAGAAAEEDLRKSGTVAVGVVESLTSDGEDDLDAQVRFVDEVGRTHTVRVDVSQADETVDIFEEGPIYYDPDDPSRAVWADIDPVDDWMSKWLGIALQILLPGAVVLFAVVRLLRANPN